jgi:hypothetical protein
MWLNSLILLNVRFWVAPGATLTNGVMVFSCRGGICQGWIEQIGSIAGNLSAGQTTVNIGILTSLIMPSEALWKRAAHELQSPLVAALGFSPFSAGSYPSLAMILYSVLYMFAAVGMAVRLFSRRDL